MFYLGVLALLSVLVLIHETGHLVAGRSKFWIVRQYSV